MKKNEEAPLFLISLPYDPFFLPRLLVVCHNNNNRLGWAANWKELGS